MKPFHVPSDTFILTGRPITIDAVVAVAAGQRVEIAPACLSRLAAARASMLRTLEAGEAVYGITTGVGALKGVRVAATSASDFNR
ncbi:MAG TPA: aromatic amino acid lyase, partial [Ktedonobacteraceae bacterium]|nr:aromatic amino acid lyase [Ktedonobacteraceae bacterium]